MKKLFFATALTLGSLSVAIASTPMVYDGIMDEVLVSDFKEIAVADLPSAVTDALEADYAGATVNKAYMNDENIYKLEVTGSDGTTGTLYADAEGNWVNM
ncbi:hypothetical protein MTsPCn5_22440 [Croceitalea sp. MTPC5]|uniref:hypothetical protein n=1 Tax=Croceitalea sp. MTPC5 TaxID=3056565 RepID=UPI002B39F16C|nr:hypothetical protein MTsPCn5_22440 [Croceitalea sp. MTPC5]